MAACTNPYGGSASARMTLSTHSLTIGRTSIPLVSALANACANVALEHLEPSALTRSLSRCAHAAYHSSSTLIQSPTLFTPMNRSRTSSPLGWCAAKRIPNFRICFPTIDCTFG